MDVARNEADSNWADLAQLDPLAAVLDPADVQGAKNRVIDRAHKRALERSVGRMRGARVLDFGCGTGRISEWLVRHGAQVDGVDVTAEMISVARKRSGSATFHLIGDQLPFQDATFDVVVTAYVLQYYVRSATNVPEELARVLKHGGLLVAIEQLSDEPMGLGRGGTAADYALMFARVGLSVLDLSIIRIGDSRIIGSVQKYPSLGHAPFLPALLRLEAQRRRGVPLIGARYGDAVFVARA